MENITADKARELTKASVTKKKIDNLVTEIEKVIVEKADGGEYSIGLVEMFMRHSGNNELVYEEAKKILENRGFIANGDIKWEEIEVKEKIEEKIEVKIEKPWYKRIFNDK